MISVIWQSYNPDRSPRLFGDQLMLQHIFAKVLDYKYQDSFAQFDGFEQHRKHGPGHGGAVVLMALEDNKRHIDRLNEDIKTLPWCLVILTQNEYGSDAYMGIKHPNMRLWLQTPAADDKADRFIALGYPSIVADHHAGLPEDRPTDWFFAGQMNHQRRLQCRDALANIPKGVFFGTPGFNQGWDYHKYVNAMVHSKIVVCPAGPETPETFRMYEALEAGCIPIVDMQDGHGIRRKDHWTKVFGEDFPLAIMNYWPSVDEVIKSELENYNERLELIMKWWADYKLEVIDDLYASIDKMKIKELGI